VANGRIGAGDYAVAVEQVVTEGAVSAPTRELLEWLSVRPRSYSETLEAWRSSCPRLTTWEDALHDRLVQVVRDVQGKATSVRLTARGRSALDAG
jgi:hypothetical protein